jgi:hypothetical protein
MQQFKLNFENQFQKAKQLFNKKVGDVTINLPFISVGINPRDTEQKVAKEITIRLADRRVLNAKECCDNCIDNALESLQEIRSNLVDKQVELSDHTDGILYLLIEFMLEAIRQFLTFEQQLRSSLPDKKMKHPEFWRTGEIREEYFDSLEILRSHLHRCLIQVSTIADFEIPKIAENLRYNSDWELKHYQEPKTLNQ